MIGRLDISEQAASVGSARISTFRRWREERIVPIGATARARSSATSAIVTRVLRMHRSFSADAEHQDWRGMQQVAHLGVPTV